MFKWSYLFGDTTLKEAESYYERVSNVKRIDNRIFGIVTGSFDYFVCITLKNNNVNRVECNCYPEYNCMHEVALLHFIDEHDYLLNPANNIEARINNLDENTSKQVLLKLLNNPSYKEEFLNSNDTYQYDEDIIHKRLVDYVNSDDDYESINVLSRILYFMEYDISMIIKKKKYDYATRLLNEIAKTYLRGYCDINYSSEDIMTDRYVNYSKILLNDENVSEENKRVMQEFVDEICVE